MPYVLKRPMFRIGGSVADKTGLATISTSRRKYADGPTEDGITSSIEDYYDNPKSYKEDYYDRPDADFTGVSEKDIHPDLYAAATLNPELSKEIIDHNIENINKTNLMGKITDSIFGTPVAAAEPQKDKNIQDKSIQDKPIVSSSLSNNPIFPYSLKDSPNYQPYPLNKNSNKVITGSDVNNFENNMDDLNKNPENADKAEMTNPNAIYNLAGNDISSSLSNIADFTKQKLTPSPQQRLNNLFLAMGASNPENPLAPSTIGSRLGKAFGIFGNEINTENKEATTGESNAITRGISTLGKAGSASANKLQASNQQVVQQALFKLNIANAESGGKQYPLNAQGLMDAQKDANWNSYFKNAQDEWLKRNPEKPTFEQKTQVQKEAAMTKSAQNPAGLGLDAAESTKFTEMYNKAPAEVKDNLGENKYINVPGKLMPSPRGDGSLIQGPGASGKYENNKIYFNLQNGQYMVFKKDTTLGEGVKGIFIPYKPSTSTQ